MFLVSQIVNLARAGGRWPGIFINKEHDTLGHQARILLDNKTPAVVQSP